MPYTGSEDHSISLEDAAKLTENYRNSVATGSVLGGYFSGTGIKTILDQDGCIGIRIYYGRSEEEEPKFVIVGVDSNGDDLYEGEIAQYSIDCPPHCPESNPLNNSEA